jgi:hypothetical protein
MPKDDQTEWRTYEDVARYLIGRMRSEFGLTSVEGKQKIRGASDANWEIEAKGLRSQGEDGFIIIECRRYTTSRLDQERIGALAFRISDTGASGAIVVSPLGLQQGAKKVAHSAGIESVLLNANSTTTDYVLRFLNKVFVGISETLTTSDTASVKTIRSASAAEHLITSDSVAVRTMGAHCLGGHHSECQNPSCYCSCHRASTAT